MRKHPDLRARILYLVEEYPGLHLRELQRRAGCSTMLAEYHLNVLQELGLVTSTKHGRYRDFFPGQGERLPADRTARRWLALLRRPAVLAVVLVLLEHGALRPGALAEKLGLAASTVSYQVKTMRAAGLVVHEPYHGRVRVRLADAEQVLGLLRTYHPTPDLITEYAALWRAIFDRGNVPTASNDPDFAEPLDDVPAVLVEQPRAVVIVYQALRDGALTQKEIRTETGQPRRTVYSALRRLRELGLVEARPNLQDTRQTHFRLVASDEPGASGSEPNQ